MFWLTGAVPADWQRLISPAAIFPRPIKMISGNKHWLLHTELNLLLLLSLEMMDFLFPAEDKGLMIAMEIWRSRNVN